MPYRVSVPTGFVAGALGALCGVGGGVLILPALRYTTRLSQHAISGTSLFAVTAASVVGATSYTAQGTANLPVAACLASTAIVSAGVGVRAGAMLRNKTLTRVVGAALLCASPLIAFKSNIQNSSQSITKTTMPRGDAVTAQEFLERNGHFLAAGVATGFASGLLGLGCFNIISTNAWHVPPAALLAPRV